MQVDSCNKNQTYQKDHSYTILEKWIGCPGHIAGKQLVYKKQSSAHDNSIDRKVPVIGHLKDPCKNPAKQ
jgi:hypothetical protein